MIGSQGGLGGSFKLSFFQTLRRVTDAVTVSPPRTKAGQLLTDIIESEASKEYQRSISTTYLYVSIAVLVRDHDAVDIVLERHWL